MPKQSSKSKPTKALRNTRAGKSFKSRRAGTHIIWPAGVDDRYGIDACTRWRWEQDKKLPPRDAFVGGEAVGWKPETLDAADRGEYVAPKVAA